ncbi:MAG: hypothetical protein BGO78_12155 [Chloroflexi bacterium 44-23]|nr:MAG: hypothetical protein BGO78_12155 [Chloroflexi bacterium 44-23]
MRKQLRKSLFIFVWLFILTALAACVANSRIELPESVNTPLIPTASLTSSPTLRPSQTPTRVVSPTPLPSPTSTPRTHLVKLGETLGGIAWTYGVSLDGILTLNPDVNPNSMKVGIEILIPAETVTPGNETPQPTPINIPIQSLNCLSDSQDGIWCFGWLANTTQQLMESALVTVNVADLDATQVFSETTVLPLNLLLPDESLPFAVYFEAPMPTEFQSSAQFNSSIPIDADQIQSERMSIKDVAVELMDGSSATIKGKYTIPAEFSQVWVVAAALDQDGQIIGLRRWQSSDKAVNEFTMTVYAVRGKIETVKVFAEAQP